MKLGRTILIWSLVWLVIITAAHGVLNWGWLKARPGGAAGAEKYRLGFLPVTYHLTCPVTDFINKETLPEELRSRWQNNDKYRLEINPRDNLMDNKSRRQFVNEVRTVTPHLTGSPVVSIEAGDAVVTAFQQAFFYALLAIIALLLVLTERKKDVIFIVAPLLLAAIFTGTTAVLLDIHLNFANIIALPLLLGIGVDSAIHILHRYRTSSPDEGPLLATSSARAVVVSALTTILSIGNLAFSEHLGTASMGKLLTIGISMTLVCTLIVLPSLLAGYYKRTLNN